MKAHIIGRYGSVNYKRFTTMSTNGKSVVTLEERERRVREADAAIERLLAEHERIGAQIEAYYEQRGRAAALLAAERGLRRSTMSAKAKSDYIQAHGIEAYQRLEW
jgi:hypothetical protein